MTEDEWLTGAELWPTYLVVRGGMSDRRQRLLACAYCRSSWDLMGRASRRAITLGEPEAL